MKKLIFLILPLALSAQSQYRLASGTTSSAGGTASSSSYTLTSITGITATGSSHNSSYNLQSGMPYQLVLFGIEENPNPTLPLSFQFFPLSPNPMRNSVSITFALPENARVRIEVYDVSGRMVWHSDEVYSPGRHSVRWLGTDVNGNRVRSGLYIVRFEGAGRVISRKLLLVR